MIKGSVIDFKCKDLKSIKINIGKTKIPVNLYQVAAGRANIHFDEMQQVKIDLRAHLIKNERLTHLFQVVSNSLEPEVRKDDLLIIDRRLAIDSFARQLDGKLIACIWEGESLVKRYKYDGKYGTLISGNPSYEPIKVEDFHYFQIWGVCTFMIRSSDGFTWNSPIHQVYRGVKEFENIMDNSGLSSEEKLLRLRKVLNKIKP